MATQIWSVITVTKKDDYIRVRVTTEEKQSFQDGVIPAALQPGAK